VTIVSLPSSGWAAAPVVAVVIDSCRRIPLIISSFLALCPSISKSGHVIIIAIGDGAMVVVHWREE